MNADRLQSHCRQITGHTLFKLGRLLRQSQLIHEGEHQLRIARLQLAYGRAREQARLQHSLATQVVRVTHTPPTTPRQPPLSPY